MATDTGLNRRLRQHSRRAGLAVGLTMALTTAICIGGFAVIYAQLQPWISDFVSQDPPDDDGFSFEIGRRDPTPTPTPEDEASDEEDPGGEPAEEDEAEPDPTEPPEPTPTPEGFVPDYQTSGESNAYNLRAGPGTDSDVVTTLSAFQPLQFLGEEEPTNNPEDGPTWMRFRTEAGDEGWVRQIDVELYDPDA